MKKLLVGSAIAGVGLSAGGLGLLISHGYDVANEEVWELAWGLLKTDPLSLIDAAIYGPEEPLFQGIAFSFGGAAVLAIALTTTSVSAIISGISAGVAKAKRSANKKARFKPKKSRKERSSSSTGFNFIGWLGAKLEGDKDVDLEGGEQAGKFMSLGKSGATKRLKVSRPLGEDIRDFVREMKGRFGLERASSPKSYATHFKEQEKATKRSEFGLLTQWFDDVKSGAFEQAGLVERARGFTAEWKESDFAEFASIDPINGAFVVRLVKSWAVRDEDANGSATEGSSGEEEVSGRRDREAMREAIRAMKRGEVLSEDEEVEVDLDADLDEPIGSDWSDEDVDETPPKGGMDDDEIAISDVDESGDEGDETSEQADAAVEEDIAQADKADEGDPDYSEAEAIAEVLKGMHEYSTLLTDVLLGVEAWPAHLEDEGDREELINSLESELASMTMFMGDTVERLIHDFAGRFEAMNWAMENPDLLEIGFAQFIANLEEKISSGEGGDEDHPAESEETQGDSGGDDGWEDEPLEASPIEDESLSDEDESHEVEDGAGEVGVADEEASEPDEEDTTTVEQEVAGESEELVSEDAGEEAEEGPESDTVDGEIPGTLDDESIEADDKDEASTDEDGEDGVAEGREESQDDTSESAAIEVEEPVSDEDHEAEAREPRSLALPPLEEMEAAGGIPLEWGRNCKKAGATEAVLAKYLFEKDGVGFRTIGVAHVLTIWKKSDGDVRVNVILRKVPDGNWSVKEEAGIRLVNEQGDFVEVSEELLGHPEIAQNKTILHFYGEGLDSMGDVRFGDDLVAVARVFSVEEIKKFITG